MSHGLSNLAPPASRALEAVGMTLVVEHSLVDFFLRVENEGAVLDDFLIQRQTGDEDYNKQLVPLSRRRDEGQ